LGDIPPALGDNGTYMALRILQQDCAAFERFIQTTGERFDMAPQLVAAKMVGRWRDGTPLAVSPDDDGAVIPPDDLNKFDHAATLDHPTNFDDADGVRCPFGAHMRRMNPRGGPVTGLQHNRRIVRRGVPYGPAYDPSNPDDGIERGLLGAFICGDLAAQFEFLYKVWSNMDITAPTLRGSRDPIIGWQPDVGGRFEVPSGDSRGVLVATDLPRLVTTRGSLYLFVPGVGGLKALAAGQW
jgi:deferrochelatase/peroxidase EfeB